MEYVNDPIFKILRDQTRVIRNANQIYIVKNLSYTKAQFEVVNDSLLKCVE